MSPTIPDSIPGPDSTPELEPDDDLLAEPVWDDEDDEPVDANTDDDHEYVNVEWDHEVDEVEDEEASAFWDDHE